jgi:hypothetical protein
MIEHQGVQLIVAQRLVEQVANGGCIVAHG